MKRYLAWMKVVLVLSSIAAYGAVTPQKNSGVLSLCNLVENWKKTPRSQSARPRDI
jgi:hypothetical protein